MESAGDGDSLSVVSTLMAGHGYWIRKNSMVAARSDFQAIYITEKDEHVALENVDLTGKVSEVFIFCAVLLICSLCATSCSPKD